MEGVDVSSNQGDIDPGWFDQWDFVLIRAFDRHGDLDSRFHQNWTNAQGRCPRAAYGWPKPGADNRALGHALASVAGDAELGVWADYEHTPEYGIATADDLAAYLDGIGDQPKGVYANAFDYPPGSAADLYPWWIANYGGFNDGARHPFAYRNSKGDLVPITPPRPWQIHQYTSKGGPDGSGLDRNYAPTLDLWGCVYGPRVAT